VGNPLPQITWTLDRVPLSEAWHVRVGDFVTDVYSVNSYVNISSARIEDGGLYACSARNSAGIRTKSARVSVKGRPIIRAMNNVTALSGQSLELYCPYAGHPIHGIHWIKGQDYVLP
jgi:Down syndrome cell adhesion protein